MSMAHAYFEIDLGDVVKLSVHLLGMNGGFNDGCR